MIRLAVIVQQNWVTTQLLTEIYVGRDSHGFTGVDERKGDRTWTRTRNLCIRRTDVQGELNHQAPIIHAPFTAESGQVDEKTDESTVNVQTEESARYDRCGNGFAEAGAKAVKEKARTLTNASYGIKLDGNHVLMPHHVRDCGSMLSRSVYGPDGRAADERRRGRAVHRGHPPSAEVVL